MLKLQPQTERRQRPPRCLIVEDSEFDRQKMCRVMRKTRSDMEIELAPNLHSAREVLKKGGVSLILLDNNLPDGLGAEFALELAQNSQMAGIPIIMVSDWPSPFMWQKAASAGVSYVLSKSEFAGRYVMAALEAKPTQHLH